jgi:hypothetical protein
MINLSLDISRMRPNQRRGHFFERFIACEYFDILSFEASTRRRL